VAFIGDHHGRPSCPLQYGKWVPDHPALWARVDQNVLRDHVIVYAAKTGLTSAVIPRFSPTYAIFIAVVPVLSSTTRSGGALGGGRERVIPRDVPSRCSVGRGVMVATGYRSCHS